MQRILLWLMFGGLLFWLAESVWHLAIGQQVQPTPRARSPSDIVRRRRMLFIKWILYLATMAGLAAWIHYGRMPPQVMALLHMPTSFLWPETGNPEGNVVPTGPLSSSGTHDKPVLSPITAVLTLFRVSAPPTFFFLGQVRGVVSWN